MPTVRASNRTQPSLPIAGPSTLKRQATNPPAGSNPTKKRKGAKAKVQGRSDGLEDSPSALTRLARDIGTNGTSTRQAAFPEWPTLASCALKAFAESFKVFAGQEGGLDAMERWFARLGPELTAKLWRRLVLRCPEILSVKLIAQHFLAQKNVYLPGETLPAIQGLSTVGSATFWKDGKGSPEIVTSLELTGVGKQLRDEDVAKMVGRLPSLNKIVLRNTVSVGPATTAAIVSLGPQLTHLNLSGTSIDHELFRDISFACPNLQVLKVANCLKLAKEKTGLQWAGLIKEIKKGKRKEGPLPVKNRREERYRLEQDEEDLAKEAEAQAAEDAEWAMDESTVRPLRQLKKLKLRAAFPPGVSFHDLLDFISALPTLEHLDVSHNNDVLAKHHKIDETTITVPSLPNLVKLNTLGTVFPNRVLIKFLKAAEEGGDGRSRLRSLLCAVRVDENYRKVMEEVEKAKGLEKLSIYLVHAGSHFARDGGTKLVENLVANVNVDGVLAGFPALKYLTIDHDKVFTPKSVRLPPDYWTGINALRTTYQNHTLERLDLNGILIDGTYAPAIARFKHLEYLDVSKSHLEMKDMLQIIDNCPRLSMIDATSCRGIGVQLRRGLFEVYNEWKTEQAENQAEIERVKAEVQKMEEESMNSGSEPAASPAVGGPSS